MADGRRDVFFQIFLGIVFGILFQLIGYVFMNGLIVFVEWDEVIAHDRSLERALVAVERCAPGVLRVVRMAPATMLPDDLDVAEIKGGRLRAGYVRFALF